MSQPHLFRPLAHFSLIMGLILFLNGCGFHLRGTGADSVAVPENWKVMYLVTSNPNSEFSRAIKTRFSANGVQWVEKDEANFWVRLGPERYNQHNLSLNSEARAAEFELTMRSTFSVQDNKGKEVMPPTEATVIKQMENDPYNVVGKAEEIRILKGEMRTALAQQIMRRIAYFAASREN